MNYRPFDEPELIEVEDWSVWLRFPVPVGQSEVHALMVKATEWIVGIGGKWEIRPIRRIEEREER